MDVDEAKDLSYIWFLPIPKDLTPSPQMHATVTFYILYFDWISNLMRLVCSLTNTDTLESSRYLASHDLRMQLLIIDSPLDTNSHVSRGVEIAKWHIQSSRGYIILGNHIYPAK